MRRAEAGSFLPSWTMRAVEHGLAGSLRRPVAVDVGVEGGGCEVQALGHFGRDSLAVSHRRHRHHQRRAIHLAWSPAHASARAGCGKPRHGALGDQFALELGERGKNAEREAAIGGRRVDLRARAGQHLQPDAPGSQVLDRIDQVTQVASEPVELPEHQRVAGLDRLQAGGQARGGHRGDRMPDPHRCGWGRRRPPASHPAAAPASGCRPIWRRGHSRSASRHRNAQERRSAPCKLAINSATAFLADSVGRSVSRARAPGNRPFSGRTVRQPRRTAAPSVSRILRRNARSRVRLTEPALSLKQRASNATLSLS